MCVSFCHDSEGNRSATLLYERSPYFEGKLTLVFGVRSLHVIQGVPRCPSVPSYTLQGRKQKETPLLLFFFTTYMFTPHPKKKEESRAWTILEYCLTRSLFFLTPFFALSLFLVVTTSVYFLVFVSNKENLFFPSLSFVFVTSWRRVCSSALCLVKWQAWAVQNNYNRTPYTYASHPINVRQKKLSLNSWTWGVITDGRMEIRKLAWSPKFRGCREISQRGISSTLLFSTRSCVSLLTFV